MKRRLSTLVCVVALSLFIGIGANAALQDGGEGVSVRPPDVEFVVYQYQDPYQGTLTNPATLDPAMRYIGAEIAIINHSHFPVSVVLGNIRLRDTEGREYGAGSVAGEDIRLNARPLAELDLARGWVWFAIPIDIDIAQLVFIPSTLELRISEEQLLPVTASPISSPIP